MNITCSCQGDESKAEIQYSFYDGTPIKVYNNGGHMRHSAGPFQCDKDGLIVHDQAGRVPLNKCAVKGCHKVFEKVYRTTKYTFGVCETHSRLGVDHLQSQMVDRQIIL